ncbi:MAG: hypothetical protein SFW08_11055 [Gemmatimonadaceae bacterium]|nr:hypothetical protein [Gemmatimonadaceae bacterium]
MSRTRRAAAVVLALVGAAGMASCGGDEIGTAGCPILCPGASGALLDSTFEAVSLDSSLTGVPADGVENELLLASNAAQNVDLRVLIRFDSVDASYAPTFADSLRPITAPDSARLTIRIDTVVSRATAPFTIDVFNIDTTTADTARVPLIGLFRPDRLLGSRTVAPDSIRDTLTLPINRVQLAAALASSARLRLGLRVTTTGRANLLVGTVDGARPAQLRYKPASDSGLPTYVYTPLSRTPGDNAVLASLLRDRALVVSGAPVMTSAQLAIGGVPNYRSFIAFAAPARIIDSTEVVRATIEITQLPFVGPRVRDTIGVYPLIVSAGQEASITRATDLAVAPVSTFRESLGKYAFTDSLRLLPGDSGVRRFDITAAVREWRVSGPNGMRRAIVLRVGPENTESGQLRFWSREAAAGLRPRLRLVFAPRQGSGLP